jgi:hypothetical protein
VEYTKSSAAERFCRDALAQHGRLFRLWPKFRGGQIDRRQLLLRSIPLQKRIFALAELHLDSPHREVRNLATAHFEITIGSLLFWNTRPRAHQQQRRTRPTHWCAVAQDLLWQSHRERGIGHIALINRRQNLRPSRFQYPGLSLRGDSLPSVPQASRLTAPPIGH